MKTITNHVLSGVISDLVAEAIATFFHGEKEKVYEYSFDEMYSSLPGEGDTECPLFTEGVEVDEDGWPTLSGEAAQKAEEGRLRAVLTAEVVDYLQEVTVSTTNGRRVGVWSLTRREWRWDHPEGDFWSLYYG